MLNDIGLFYAGYGAILTPAFGVVEAYGDILDGYMCRGNCDHNRR